MAVDRPAEVTNRAAITVCVILATIMQALDTTIANIALPYIQGSVSASQDQINWVLTAYIVAAAIMTPPTGFLAGRFGRRRLLLMSVAGWRNPWCRSCCSESCKACSARRSSRSRNPCCSTSIRRNARDPRWRCGASR
jgi:hypothetical protein